MTTSKRIIPAGEFKAHCLRLMNEVAAKGEEIVVTKRGKPLVRLLPPEPAREAFGAMKGTVKILGDIIEPFDVEWEALEGNIFPPEPKKKKKKRTRA